MPRFGGMGGAFGRMGGGGKVAAAAAAAAAFSPLDLTPALWIDPSDSATMFQLIAGTTAVTDGSVCGFAGDKSGAVFDLTATADDTTRPTWVSTGGFPYISIASASSQKLRRVANLGLWDNGSFSLFVAVRGNPATTAYLAGEYSNAALGGYLRSDNTTSTTASAFVRADDGATTYINNGALTETNGFDNTDRVYGVTDSGSLFTSYLNGVSHDSQAYARSAAMNITKFCIGAELRGAGASFWNGRLYGLVAVKRVITAGEIASLTTYLGAKMGITL